ncbi:hypothetical protein BWR59_12275 [Pseudomonas sp. Bc-h]|nr:hypothetical protein BWR59_12275 [Pseudomonas sp. Bc-h]
MDWALGAPLIKKCAILAISRTIDQCYTENYDECCAMLRAVSPAALVDRVHRNLPVRCRST